MNRFIHSLRPVERVALNAGLSPELKLTVAALESPERVVGEELIAERLTRDIYSPAQLQEVMTDFWLNHFNVYLRKNEQMPYYLVSYERDTIRPRSLGKFEDLLEAVAHSPAMLVYLDNAESLGPHSLAAERAQMAASRQPNKKNVREGLNENYARELMELHTLGVNGGYTQADVTEVARVLTGWTIDRPQVSAQFTFNPNRHEPGNKKVLGQKIKESGEMEGRELLHMLATRPATAQFISRKLAMRFVSDDPPQALVDRIGKVVSLQRRRYFRSAEDAVPLARVLVNGCLPGEGQDADRVCGFSSARQQCGDRQLSASGQPAAPDGHAGVRRDSPDRLQLASVHVGEHGSAGGPDEFFAVAGGQPAARHHQ